MFLDKITIHELILLILFLLVTVVFLIVAILLYSLYKYKSYQNKLKWTQLIEHKITDAIVEGVDSSESDVSFAPYLKEKSFRNLFLAVLVSSNNRFAGSAQREVLGLFHSFGLENDAWKKVKKKSPYIISGGIHELTRMQVNEIVPDLMKLLNHSDKHVYQEAQYSLVYFKGFDGLFFLDNLKTTLTDWQQLRLLKSINKIGEENIEQIPFWLKSSNKSVVIFTLRLIAHFQLLAYYNQVIDLLTDVTPAVRKQVILTLQSLEKKETNFKLMKVFDQEELLVQLEILRMFKLSKDSSTKAFLEHILVNDYDAQLKIIAAETLVILGEESHLKELLTQEVPAEENISLIIKHALQERIW